jgi:hypothetical protein
MSSAFNKLNCFVQDIGQKVHNLNSDAIYAALTNTAPVATTTAYSGITDLGTGNGYTAGGAVFASTAYSQTGGVATLTGSNIVITASSGSIGPERYSFVYNNTAAGKNGIGWWDYGSSVTLTAGETFTINISSGIAQLQ